MLKHSPGWAVQISGQQFDLENLRTQFQSPFDPWVEDDETSAGNQLLLRAKTWEPLGDAAQVHASASLLIDQINGAMPLVDADATPLTLGAIIRFDERGNRHINVIMQAVGVAIGAARVRAVSTGGPVAAPQESRLQGWLRAAENDDTLAEYFLHLGRATNWFDIYKACELLRKLAGGQHELEAKLGDKWGGFDRIWKTANFHRHAPGLVNPLPKPPATLQGARSYLYEISANLI